MSGFFQRLKNLSFWSRSDDASSDQDESHMQKSHEDVRLASEKAVKRWSNTETLSMEDRVLSKNLPSVPVVVSIDPKREDMIRRQEVEILKKEEQTLKSDLSRILGVLIQMEKRYAEMMQAEEQRKAEICARFEERKEEYVQKLSALTQQQEDYQNRLSQYELNMARVKTEHTIESKDREEDIAASQELQTLVDAEKARFEEDKRKYLEQLETLSDYSEKRRADDFEETKRYVETKKVLEERLGRLMVLRKAMEDFLAKHNLKFPETANEGNSAVQSSDEDKLMVALDWTTNMKQALVSMKTGDGAKELNKEDELEAVEGYKISQKVARKTFLSVVYETQRTTISDGQEPTLHAQVFQFKTDAERSLENQLKKEGFRIIRFICKTPFKNLIQIHDLFVVCKKAIIIQEALTIGLEHFVREEMPLSEEKVRKYAEGLALAVNFLHNIGVAHQNINRENIFKNANGEIKLGGLEYATLYYDVDKDEVINQKNRRNKPEGTYKAPEISLGIEYNPAVADAFSYGVMVVYLVIGTYPYDSKRKQSGEKQWETARGILEARVGDSCLNLLQRCLQIIPEHRITMRDAVVHPWFADNL